MDATFKKSERLSGKKLIGEIFSSGKAVKEYPFILLYKPCDFEKAVPARLAISVPKRRVKSAVKRNRVRRWVRESYRINKQPLYTILSNCGIQFGMLLIFVGSEPKLDSNLVHEKISRLIARLNKEVSENYQAEKQDEKHKTH